MTRKLTIRLWLEVVLAAISLAALALTLVLPTWVEAAVGVDPDRSSGGLEWAVVAGLAGASATLAGLAWGKWQRRLATAV